MEEIILSVENAPYFTRVFDNTRVHRKQVSINGDTIIMPTEFYPAISDLCSHERETRGIMLCTKKGSVYQVWFVASLGQGTSIKVFPDTRKRNALNKLIADYGRDMILVDWHTHTLSTGEDYYQTFSAKDYQSLYNGVESAGKNRMHILFTPECVLTWGINKPGFIVHDHPNPKAVEYFSQWKALYDQYYINESETEDIDEPQGEERSGGGFLNAVFNFLR